MLELARERASAAAVVLLFALVHPERRLKRLCRAPEGGCDAWVGHDRYAVWTTSLPKPSVSSSSAWNRTVSAAGAPLLYTGDGDAAS